MIPTVIFGSVFTDPIILVLRNFFKMSFRVSIAKREGTLPLFLEGFGFHLTESDSILEGIRGK
jgi:hypothetical protein